jgi:hypothetical protein
MVLPSKNFMSSTELVSTFRNLATISLTTAYSVSKTGTSMSKTASILKVTEKKNDDFN